MANLQLPPSVRDLRGTAIEAIANRMAQIDLSPLLIYRIATTPAAAIPFLAWQFDVLSPMYQLLAPGADQRQIVQNAIALKRFMGTPYAVKTALANLGWPNATILEGQNAWGGTSWPADEGWAVCRLLIPLGGAVMGASFTAEAFAPWQAATSYPAGLLVTYGGNYFKATAPAAAGTIPQFATIDQVPDVDLLADFDTLVQLPWQLLTTPPDPPAFAPVTSAQVAQIIAAFDFFAPERCWLDSVIFVVPTLFDALAMIDTLSGGEVDALAMADAITATYPGISDAILNSVLYDSLFDYSGVTHADELVGITDGPITVNGTPWEGNQ